MSFWGWRQGACAVFISVLVTACAPAHPNPLSPSPTVMDITLTVFKPPGSTATPRAPYIITATPALHARALDLLPPRCEELVSGGTQCVGVLRNPNPEAVGWVVIHAESADFSPVSAALEQRLIPAGTDAPYRLLLDSSADMLILSLEAVDVTGGWVDLDVADDLSQANADGYQVTARLLNPSHTTVTDGRAVVMVFDGEVLLGYRVVELGELAAGEGATIDLSWAGMTGAALRHTVSAIAWEA